MGVRGVALSAGVVVVVLGLVLYQPLPPVLEDRYRAMLVIGPYRFVTSTLFNVLDWLNLGTFYDYLPIMQELPPRDLTAPPRSASFGDLEVSRAKLAGVEVIVYRPKDMAAGERLSALIYIHGGGFCMYHPDFYDATVYTLANCTRKVTISIDYRRPPDHTFPAPVQDCIDVTTHVLKHGATLGIDVTKVGVAGDSAGGTMAAVTAAHVTKAKGQLPPLQYQLLLWPATQAVDFRLPSYRELSEAVPLPPAPEMAGFWGLYMGLDPSKMKKYIELMVENRHIPPSLLKNSPISEHINIQNLPKEFQQPRPEVMGGRSPPPAQLDLDPDLTPPYDEALYQQIKDKVTHPMVSPLFAADLTQLPQALVVVAEFDPLRDDGLLYAHRLREAGVPTEVFRSKGFHDDFIVVFPESLQSKTGMRAMKVICDYIKKITS